METELAREALTLWSISRAAALAPQNGLTNSVFAVEHEKATCFLRLSDPDWQELDDTEVEIAFVTHLAASGVPVAEPIPSITGRLVEKVGDAAAVLFRLAPGRHVVPSDPDWGEALFREWGRMIARQHVAAGAFPAPAETWRRDWRLEPPVREGLAVIEAGDIELARAAATLLSELERYGAALGEVGMIHGDQAPQNFRYDREAGITMFDFANCCRHWFLYDLAVARYSLRRVPDHVRLAAWINDGYRELRRLPGDMDLLGLLIRLRTFYVYCDRLKQFGERPDAEQSTTLRDIRGRFLTGRFSCLEEF